MARLWMQRGLEDVDFVIHVLLSLAPRTDSAPGSPGFDTSQLRSLLLDHVAALPRFSSLMVRTLTRTCRSMKSASIIHYACRMWGTELAALTRRHAKRQVSAKIQQWS